MHNDLHLLTWAIGGETPPAERLSDLDVDRLMHLVAAHRLAGRLLHRLRTERPKWAGPRLLFGAAALHREAAARSQRHLAALQALNALASAESGPPVAIKGLTSYLLTGDERALRISGDVDVIFRDFEGVEYALEAAGARIERRASHGDCLNPHEAATVRFEGAMFDVHNHYPVWSYPSGICTIPETITGTVVERLASRTERDICYDDLMEHCAPARLPEGAELLIPSPEMSALILCAHEFKEFVESPFRQTHVKLGTLADTGDLFEYREFEPARFERLVDRYNAYDAVAFVAHLFEICGGGTLRQPPWLRSFLPRERRFPQLLHFLGGWAILSREDGDWISAVDAARADRLHPTLLRVGDNSGSEAQSSITTIVQSVDGDPIPFSASLIADEAGPCLRVHIRNRLPSEHHGYRLEFRLTHEESFGAGLDIMRRNLCRVRGDDTQAAVDRVSDGYDVHLTLAWPPQVLASLRPIHLSGVVLLTRWDERLGVLSLGNMDSLVAVPVRIVLA